MKKLSIIVEKTETGYSAYAEEYPVYTVGNNLDDLKSNILEAINLYFEEEKRTVTAEDLRITLDLPQFFEFYKVINAKALSERIGMNQSLLAQYIKGNKKPSPAQVQRIMKGVQQIGRELSEIGFLI
ncbi:MAG TPA: type II toxin-antitoxin system HicB family antitoxin [Prolixibacteraceae bacterium]|nr:type II toxin-antitoxin system HicB family antitoxin [Prolixibacteraceae bacterium]